MGEVGEREGVWEAKNRERHLCGEDLYAASWRFAKGVVDGSLAGLQAEEEERWWEVRYDVKGPKKDYVSTTRYERVQNSA
jgi:tRNA A64-2'-O-ribosylphosphate transferase